MKTLFLSIKITFVVILFSNLFSFAQNNEIQFRLIYIDDAYYPIFQNGALLDWYKAEINSKPFTFTQLDGVNVKSFQYYYLGGAFKRDSVFGTLFFRFRIDRFYFQSTFDGYTSGVGNPVKVNSKTKLTSTQFTPGFGKSILFKFFQFSGGLEFPFHWRNNSESNGTFYYYDSTGKLIPYSDYQTKPGGYFIGTSIFISADVAFSKKFMAGIETSGGVIYHRDGYSTIGGVKALFHNPALNLSYKF